MIIIKTPQPDTEERLVLVPLDACSEVREDDPRARLGARVGLTVLGTYARDATAADLERAGEVRERVEPTGPGTLAHLENAVLNLRAELAVEKARADQADRELDGACSPDCQARIDYVEADNAKLRVELARLTAPGEGEPTDNELRAVWDPEPTITAARRALFRAGVAHERAKDRAERCLTAQAVGMGADVRITRSARAVAWDIDVTRRPVAPGARYVHEVKAADVPATLARLLGEVSRG